MKTKKRYKLYFTKEKAKLLGISTIICRNDVSQGNLMHAHKIVDRETGRYVKDKYRPGMAKVRYATTKELS